MGLVLLLVVVFVLFSIAAAAAGAEGKADTTRATDITIAASERPSARARLHATSAATNDRKGKEGNT